MNNFFLIFINRKDNIEYLMVKEVSEKKEARGNSFFWERERDFYFLKHHNNIDK